MEELEDNYTTPNFGNCFASSNSKYLKKIISYINYVSEYVTFFGNMYQNG